MADCIFCKIISREVGAEIVYEDEALVAFADIHPKAPIHILVVPRTHIESIARLAADHADVIAQLIYAAKRIAAERGLAGYKLVFNVGREGGQLVDHLHLHLLGGWKNLNEWRKQFMAGHEDL